MRAGHDRGRDAAAAAAREAGWRVATLAPKGRAALKARVSHDRTSGPWRASALVSTGTPVASCTAARRTRSGSGSIPAARARWTRCDASRPISSEPRVTDAYRAGPTAAMTHMGVRRAKNFSLPKRWATLAARAVAAALPMAGVPGRSASSRARAFSSATARGAATALSAARRVRARTGRVDRLGDARTR